MIATNDQTATQVPSTEPVGVTVEMKGLPVLCGFNVPLVQVPTEAASTEDDTAPSAVVVAENQESSISDEHTTQGEENGLL